MSGVHKLLTCSGTSGLLQTQIATHGGPRQSGGLMATGVKAAGMASPVTKCRTCSKIEPGIYGWEFMTVCMSSRMDVSAVSPNLIISPWG